MERSCCYPFRPNRLAVIPAWAFRGLMLEMGHFQARLSSAMVAQTTDTAITHLSPDHAVVIPSPMRRLK
jgi:hypothetical protein